MSQTGVGMVVPKLLTDERLRIRFALDRMETIAELCLGGFELTRDEFGFFTGRMLVSGSLATKSTANGCSEDDRCRAVCHVWRDQENEVMAIDVDTCAAQETIVITTRSSVYELVVPGDDRGDVLVRGGKYFTESGARSFSVRLRTTVRWNRTSSVSAAA